MDHSETKAIVWALMPFTLLAVQALVIAVALARPHIPPRSARRLVWPDILPACALLLYAVAARSTSDLARSLISLVCSTAILVTVLFGSLRTHPVE